MGDTEVSFNASNIIHFDKLNENQLDKDVMIWMATIYGIQWKNALNECMREKKCGN